MKRAYTLNTMIRKIENPSQEIVDVNLSSQDFSLDDEEAQRIKDAVANTKRAKTIIFSRILVSPWSGTSIFSACVENAVIENITFPIWGMINSPGQRPLMEMEEDFPIAVEAHNESIKTDLIAYKFFKKLNDRIFKATHKKKEGESESEIQIERYFIEPKILEDHLAPFLLGGSSTKRSIKKLRLYQG